MRVKHPVESKTIWGIIIAAIPTILPIFLGVPDPGGYAALGQLIVQIVGLGVATKGRFDTTEEIHFN